MTFCHDPVLSEGASLGASAISALSIQAFFPHIMTVELTPRCRLQVLELRGRAFQEYGQAAVVQSIVDRLPDIAREIASPLAKTEKVGTQNSFEEIYCTGIECFICVCLCVFVCVCVCVTI